MERNLIGVSDAELLRCAMVLRLLRAQSSGLLVGSIDNVEVALERELKHRGYPSRILGY